MAGWGNKRPSDNETTENGSGLQLLESYEKAVTAIEGKINSI
jgi:hypothetical protein